MKHLIKVKTMPTVGEFNSNTWADRKPYVGLTVDNNEVFYNYASSSTPDVGGVVVLGIL